MLHARCALFRATDQPGFSGQDEEVDFQGTFTQATRP